MIQWLMILFRRFGDVRASQVLRVSILFFVLLLYASVGYCYFEGRVNPEITWLDSIWWAIVTMTTVGYGDMFPTTIAGRFLIGFPTMLLGVSILGYVLSVVATAMVESRMKELKGMKAIELNNHIVVCNYVSAEKLNKLIDEIHHDRATAESHIVLIDPLLEEIPAELQGDLMHFVKGAPMRESTLVLANITTAHAVILQADADRPEDSDNENLRTALTLQSMVPNAYVCVECMNTENRIFFERAGCNSVVCISALSSQMIVQELQDPGVARVVAELTSNTQGKQFYIAEIDPTCATFSAVKELYSNDETLVVGLKRGDETLLLPSPDFVTQPSDRIVFIAASRPS